jgi:transcriptional regulator with XRE-family HTH domain
MEFKDRLKELREQRGISQLELSQKLHISNAVISMYEKGVRAPSRETLEALADYFNVDIDYLMGREIGSTYYLDPEAAEIAQELYSRPELKILFKASRDISAEDLKVVQATVEALRSKK